MSNIKSSKKQAIKAKKLKEINSSRKSMLKTLIKKFYEAINKKDKLSASNCWIKVQSTLDRFSKKHLLHKNKAARYKSRLHLMVKKLIES